MGEEGKDRKHQIEASLHFPLRMTTVVDLFFIYALHSTARFHSFSTSTIQAIRNFQTTIANPKYTGLTLLAPAPVNSADSEGTSTGRDDGIQPAT